MKCCLNLHVCEKVRHFSELLSRNTNEAIMGIARARSKRCRRSSAMEIKGYLDEWGFNVIQSRKIRTCGFHGRLGLKHKKKYGIDMSGSQIQAINGASWIGSPRKVTPTIRFLTVFAWWLKQVV